MKVSYLHHDGINSTWAEEVISVDLIPTISKFCNEFPTDPDCKSSDLSVIDVSASNGQQQLSLPIGSSADVTLQTTVTNTGPDTPIDAILSSNVITPSESRGVLVTPAAGANPNNNGATTTRTILASLNEAQQDGQTYTIECWEPGIHDIIFESEIAPQSGAVDDANQLNNKGQLKFAVDCGVNGIIPPPVPLGVSIEANVTEDGSPPTTIEFRAITGGGTQPHKFRWSFDDGEGNSNDNNVKGDQLMTHQFTRLGQHNVTVTVTDSANGFRGQTASDNIIVTISDKEPPQISVPRQIIAEARGPNGANVTFTVSATDIVDGSVPVSCRAQSSGTFQSGTTTANFKLGTTTVNCHATDSSGNTGYGNFTVTVQDTTPPIITVPEDIVVEATGPEGAVANFTVSATDVVDGKATLEEDGVLIQGDNIRGNITISCNPRSGDTFELGDTAPSTPASAATSGSVFMQSAPSTSVNCYAEDSSDNGVNGSFPVTVRDTTPSTITISSPSITFEAPPPDNTILTSTPAVPLNPLMVRLQVNSAPASAPTSDILFVQTAPTPSATVTFFVVATDIVDGKATLGKNDILIQGDNIRGNITIDCDPASGFKLLLNETRTVNCYAQDSS